MGDHMLELLFRNLLSDFKLFDFKFFMTYYKFFTK